MKIPNTLPQFEMMPALFVTSGEFEAKFFIAFKGEIDLLTTTKMAPREEAKEKQAFVGHKGGMQSLSAVSHKDNYVRTLKIKFIQSVTKTLRDAIVEHKLREIFIFAPKGTINEILSNLNKSEQEKIAMQFYKEYTKESPLKLLEVFQRETQNIQRITIEKRREQVILR